MDQAATNFNDLDDPGFRRRLLICIVLLSIMIGFWLRNVGFGSVDMPWEVRCFFNEYGPIILDFLLALPLVSSFRRLWTDTLNRNIAKRNHRPMLLELPNELLVQICDSIMFRPCPRNSPDCAGHPPYKRAISNLSRTNRQLHQLLAPQLFTVVILRNRTWWRANRALKSLQESSHPSHSIKKLYIYFHNINEDSDQPPAPPRALPQSVAIVLSNMSCLTTLSFNVPFAQVGKFRTVFNNRNLTLPTIRTLLLSPRADWLISKCPNVHTVAADIQSWRHVRLYERNGDYLRLHTLDLIRSASQAPKLQHFEVYEDMWQPCLMEIKKAMPHLLSLGQVTGCYDEGIEPLLPLLARFEDLRTLTLDEISDLHVGFNPPRCGNVYMGPDGEEYRKEVDRQGQEAMQNVARQVFEAVSGLQELWIGNYDRAVLKRRDVLRGVEEIEWFSEVRKIG